MLGKVFLKVCMCARKKASKPDRQEKKERRKGGRKEDREGHKMYNMLPINSVQTLSDSYSELSAFLFFITALQCNYL